MTYSDGQIWLIIALLGIGTYLIRLSFIGLYGRVRLPLWALRLLRYTPVAVLPGLVAPMVLWPAATGGSLEPARLIAAAVALAVGVLSRNVLAAMASGGATLYALLWLLG